MMWFWILFSFLICQRGVELFIAKRNERWMKDQGAKEFGEEHYGLLVAMHVSFFVSLVLEVQTLQPALSPYAPLFLFLFLLAQWLRVWAITSLGRFWNTKILVLPNTRVIARGPYTFMRHPNYVVITLELATLPLLFQAYFTFLFFFVCNLIILSIRIPEEERALQTWTNYDEPFAEKARFIPKRPKL